MQNIDSIVQTARHIYFCRENILCYPSMHSRQGFRPFGPFHCRDDNVSLPSMSSRQN